MEQEELQIISNDAFLLANSNREGSGIEVEEIGTHPAVPKIESSDEAALGLAADSTLETRVSRPTTFAKVEKSLASLGFFTPSSRRIKNQRVKRIGFTREVDGKRVEVSAEIHPSGMFGLPVTADQDKYLALQKLITNKLQSEGKIANPIRFKSSELLRLLNTSTKTGKNYKAISEWLDVMSTTTIISDGAVFEAGKKRFGRDRFRVFDRALSFGKELDDGSVADANYVWLSTWQLDNINNKFLVPIDLETYRELKNHIAKALVPLLQIWLYASKKAECFEKRYTELCEILTLQTYRAPSEILRQFKPSLDELAHHGYIEKWSIEKTSDRKVYKIIFFHGPKFHRDRRRRLEQKDRTEPRIVIGEFDASDQDLPEPGKVDVPADATEIANRDQFARQHTEAPDARGKLVDDLSARGLMPSAVLKLLDSLPPDQLGAVADYVDYFDQAQKAGIVGPGLLYDLIKKGEPLPAGFETSRARTERIVEDDRRKSLARVQEALKADYDVYTRETIDRFIAEGLPPGDLERRVAEYLADPANQSDFWSERPDLAAQFARHAIRAEISKTVTVLSYDIFSSRELPRVVSELQLDPAQFGIVASTPAITTSDAFSNELNARGETVSSKDEVLPVSTQSSSPQTKFGLTEAVLVPPPSVVEHQPFERSEAVPTTDLGSIEPLISDGIIEEAPEDKGEEMKSSPLNAA